MANRTAAAIFIILFTLAPFVVVARLVEFDRTECYHETRSMLLNGSLANDSWVFHRDWDGLAMSNPDNPTLTYRGCIDLCGPRRGYYKDIGPRLTAWLVPILLLISNVELSPLDKRRFASVLHLLGDPVHSMWSFVHKAEAWSHCWSLSNREGNLDEDQKRVFATILAAVEEVIGSDETILAAVGGFAGLEEDPLALLRLLVAVPDLTNPEEYLFWGEVANEMADGRTDEILRTCLAILLYVYQVIAAFVPAVGGGSITPPGGRIGTAIFLSWLVPIVLLSNAIGSFPSRRTCIRVLERIARHQNRKLNIPLDRYFESQSWSGAIYSYRPRRKLSNAGSTRRTVMLLILSGLPVIISTSGAFTIIWYTPPNGLNCRHMWVFGICLGWFFSAFITHLTYETERGKKHWHFTLVKDALIAFPSLVIIFLSSCGYFNSCKCWSGFLRYGSTAHVPLNTDPVFEKNNETIYPEIVAVCLVLQVLVFICIVVMERHGLSVMRWSETRRMRVWRAACGDASRTGRGGQVIRQNGQPREQHDQNRQNSDENGPATSQNGQTPVQNNEEIRHNSHPNGRDEGFELDEIPKVATHSVPAASPTAVRQHLLQPTQQSLLP